MEASTRKMRGLRIATRCADVEQFVATFHRFCTDKTFFVSTTALRPVGLETAFSLDLIDNSPALRGIAVVESAWSDATNPFGKPGMQFGIRKLTTASERVFEQLLVARAASGAVEEPQDASNTDVTALPIPPASPPDGARTPGSELVLPANPLSGIPDSSLSGFVECTLYEETGNFFPVEPAPEESLEPDPEAPPPVLSPIAPRARSAPIVAEPTPPPQPPPQPPPRRPLATPPPIPVVAAPPSQEPAPARAPAPVPAPASVAVAAPVAAAAPVPVPAAVAAPAAVAVPVSAPPAAPLPPPTATPRSAPRLPTFLVGGMRDRRRMLLAGIAIVSCAIIAIVIVVLATSSSSAAHEPPAPPPAPKPLATKPPPPPAAPAPSPPAATVATTAAPPAESGPPTVGSGPCKLVVTSTPAGSVVAVDGETAGPTPLAIASPCTKRKIDISHPRYASATRTVTLAEDKPQTLDVSLQRPMHKLLVVSTPLGATVSIAGKRAGTSPTYVDVMGFTGIPITVEKPGFYPVTKTVYSKVPNDRLVVRLVKSLSAK